MKQKGKRYEIINVHPTYESEEQKQEAYKELALELALIADRYGYSRVIDDEDDNKK